MQEAWKNASNPKTFNVGLPSFNYLSYLFPAYSTQSLKPCPYYTQAGRRQKISRKLNPDRPLYFYSQPAASADIAGCVV